MKLRFLGIGSAFNPAMGNTGAFFTRGDDLYLLDCGEQAFERLMRTDLLTRHSGKIVVLLTHLHADHAGSLSTLCLFASIALRRKAVIVHPSDAVRTLLEITGMPAEDYTLLPDYTHNGFTATPIPSNHVPTIPAFSFLLTDEEGTVYYSGDNGQLPLEVLDGLRNGDIRRAYVDTTSHTAKPGDHVPHLPYDVLCRLVEPPLRSKFTLMHFNGDFRAQAEADGFACAAIDPIFEG